jgi:hypothetical protein
MQFQSDVKDGNANTDDGENFNSDSLCRLTRRQSKVNKTTKVVMTADASHDIRWSFAETKAAVTARPTSGQ